MKALAILMNSAVMALVLLSLALYWMLKDEKDKSRPLLVFALILNFSYGTLFKIAMKHEGGLLPWKYDLVLFRMDGALGISAASIALPLQGLFRIPLIVVYEILVPTMIGWYFVTRPKKIRGAIVLAYVAEMIAGPILYAILPACGPIYAFGAQWLHPPLIPISEIRLAYDPNAFPSLHVATALVLVLFSPDKLWRAVSLLFLAGTVLATLSTGEHYVIDLVSGLIFGCFAASVGHRKFRSAVVYFSVVLSWSLAIRFEYIFLILHPSLVRSFAVLSVGLALFAVLKSQSIQTEVAPNLLVRKSLLPVSSHELPPSALRP